MSIRTLNDYVNWMDIYDDGYIGDLWDDFFDPDKDPMDRDMRLAMIYVVNYFLNTDVQFVINTILKGVNPNQCFRKSKLCYKK